ncbi:hypothetical protein A0J61_06021 [Choanephora cucurbitarum]|uniref:Uncharacterized protein n=1 Tax=Choanephora cucurbitarum TaxID=101091 RepID=A0A1C7NAE4_9FUNG|nr:hypothetical protein A0J61_06021 [Choanephora cucurbitarum]
MVVQIKICLMQTIRYIFDLSHRRSIQNEAVENLNSQTCSSITTVTKKALGARTYAAHVLENTKSKEDSRI